MTDIDKALERVPEYARFLSVDELFTRARAAAEAHPDLASYQGVGYSTDGEVIPMVRIGDGPTHILLFACPHPNEPIGAMLVQFLLDELFKDASLCAGRSWFLLPCVDPDGTRLNEGWFGGPFTVQTYAQHFYRPRSEEQVEWTFPIDYKRLHFDQPMPETRALMTAFEAARPHLVYSLHNAGFGGVYYYLTHNLTDAYPALRSVPERLGLYLSLGEPEMPWAQEFAPAVYRAPSIRDSYDYHETYSERDPAELIQGGGSSFDYLRDLGSPVALITELPYFQSEQIADLTPMAQTRGEVILEGVARGREMVTGLQALLERAEPHMTLDTRFYRTVRSFAGLMLNGLKSKAAWAERAEGMAAPATVAQRTDELFVGAFYRLLVASMLRRALDAQQATMPDARLETIQTDLEAYLERWTRYIEESLEYSAIPIRRLVQAQYGALLAVLASDSFKATLT